MRERSGGATVDPLTGLPGAIELHEWLRVLLSEYRRHGHPFSVLVVGIDGLGYINDAYGHDSGDRMLFAVSGVLRRQIRAEDRAFRLDDAPSFPTGRGSRSRPASSPAPSTARTPRRCSARPWRFA